MDILSHKHDEVAEKRPAKRVILLQDLDGAEDEILGGAGEKLFFGEFPVPPTDFPTLGGSAGRSGK